MYIKDDYVRYGAKGIFQIKDIIEKKDVKGHQTNWYVLYSLKGGIETSIVTPASNETIRKVLDKQAMQRLLKEMPTLDTIWTENKAQRYELFQEILESGSIRKLAQLAKTIYLVKDEKELQGKHIAEKDMEYLRRAQQFLFEEISLSYHIKEEDVLDMILHKAGIL